MTHETDIVRAAAARFPARPASRVYYDAPPVLIGVTGMLHLAWTTLLSHWRIPHSSLYRDQMDFTRPATIAPLITPGTKLVINCAAWTDVDGAEANEKIATVINGDALEHLGAACKAVGALLVHYSTDYVFNGQGTAPYRTDAPLDPLNAYGRSKAVGEQKLIASGCDYLLIRTSWVYAPWGKNFVRTIASLLKQGKELKVVDDQKGRPTSAEHLAATSARLVEAGAKGIYHLTDGGECNWYEFANEIAKLVKPGGVVKPCTSAEYPRPAKRPAYSVLDLAPAERLIGPTTPWQAALADVVSRLE